MRCELSRAVAWWRRCRSLRRSRRRRWHRRGSFWGGWGSSYRRRHESRLRSWPLAALFPLPFRFRVDSRLAYGPSTLARVKEQPPLEASPRQPAAVRRRRLQQRWNKLQRDEAGNHDGSSFSHKLPANAESHRATKPPAQGVRPPEAMKRGAGVVMGVPREAAPQSGFEPRSGTNIVSEANLGTSRDDPRPPNRLGSSRATPAPPYATASRNSAMSSSWSSTQSPGLREKMISFRCCARTLRSSGSIVSAR